MSDLVAEQADSLRRAAAAAISDLACVVRLEPTLSNALRRLQNATWDRASPGERSVYSAADGIRLARHGDLVDIHTDVTITTDQPANVTARLVQDTLRAAVVAHRLIPGLITVTVLQLRP
ncbi:MAG: hypothetical protein ABWX96_21745 [Propionibacteriaceae bacterium]